MSVKIISDLNNTKEIKEILQKSLNKTSSSWLNSIDIIKTISDKIGIPDSRSLLLPPPSSTFARRTYGRHYDRGYSNYRYSDSSYYNTGGYRDYNNNYRDYGYNENIYQESTGYRAYGRYGNYSDYYDYYDYGNYSNYNNYTNVYFYWTKNNDGSTVMTGSETGLISPWAMAVQMNKLIGLVNKYCGRSIATVSTGSLLTAAKYNEVASALGVSQLSAGTKITVQHFYVLQTTFNSKGFRS